MKTYNSLLIVGSFGYRRNDYGEWLFAKVIDDSEAPINVKKT